jgi:hypothetical protein
MNIKKTLLFAALALALAAGRGSHAAGNPDSPIIGDPNYEHVDHPGNGIPNNRYRYSTRYEGVRVSVVNKYGAVVGRTVDYSNLSNFTPFSSYAGNTILWTRQVLDAWPDEKHVFAAGAA